MGEQGVELRYIHCRNCMGQQPENISPEEWTSMNAGLVLDDKDPGLILFCKRCDMIIANFPIDPSFLEDAPELDCDFCRRGIPHDHGEPV